MFLMPVALAPNIIDVNVLRRGHPRFDAGLHRVVRTAAHCSREMEEAGFAVAYAVIHPLYCSLQYAKPEDAMAASPHDYEPFQSALFWQQRDPRNHYSAYKKRLESVLRMSPFPLFCFVSEGHRGRVEEWLKGLSIQAPVIMIKTKEGNPLPLLDGINEKEEERLWRTFVGILVELGVNIIPVMGELHYSSKGEIDGVDVSLHHGCAGKVVDVLTNLKEENRFHAVDPVSGYTYPGFVYQPHDFKRFINDMAIRGGTPLPF